MERADPHQATSGQRDDSICWIDPWSRSNHWPWKLISSNSDLWMVICGVPWMRVPKCTPKVGLCHGKSHWNGWLGGSPISGNHHVVIPQKYPKMVCKYSFCWDIPMTCSDTKSLGPVWGPRTKDSSQFTSWDVTLLCNSMTLNVNPYGISPNHSPLAIIHHHSSIIHPSLTILN